MDNILENIKKIMKTKLLSVCEYFFLVVSFHISLLISNKSEIFIESLLNKISNYEINLNILFSTALIFSIINYIFTYKQELSYLKFLMETLKNPSLKIFEEQYKKNYLKIYLRNKYVLITTYLISLFKFYDRKYAIFYIVIIILYFALESSLSSIYDKFKRYIKY